MEQPLLDVLMRRSYPELASALRARIPRIVERWASLVRQDVRTLLERIQHPTLVVHGAQSRLYGEDTADHLVAALPHARAVRFERSGHAPHLEQPELFNQSLTDFADRLFRGRAAPNEEI